MLLMRDDKRWKTTEDRATQSMEAGGWVLQYKFLMSKWPSPLNVFQISIRFGGVGLPSVHLWSVPLSAFLLILFRPILCLLFVYIFLYMFFFRPILPWPSFPSRTPWAAGWVPGCPASRWASRKLLERRHQRYLKKGGIKKLSKKLVRISFECRSECRQAGLSRTVGAAWKRCLLTRWFSISFFLGPRGPLGTPSSVRSFVRPPAPKI